MGQVSQIQLRDEEIFEIPFPSNIRKQDAKNFYYGKVKHYPEITAHCITDVTALRSGFLLKGGGFLPQTFIDKSQRYNFLGKALNFRIKAYLNTQRVKLEEALWIYHPWGDNFFHWHFDVLQKWLLFRQTAKTVPVIIPKEWLERRYVLETLEYYNVPYVKLLESARLVVRKLWFIEPTFNGRIFLKECWMANKLEEKEGEIKIYISRGIDAKRKVINEVNVISMLKQRGFKIVNSESLSYREQVNLFQNASIVIAPHGAGLTNLINVPSNSKVIELRSNREMLLTYYMELCGVLGLEYNCLLCDTAGDPSIDWRFQDIYVPIDELINLLDE